MHILDLIMYLPYFFLVWYVTDKMSDGEFTQDLGCLIGVFIQLIFLIVYIVIFAVYDNDWIDIFKGISLPDITFKW